MKIATAVVLVLSLAGAVAWGAQAGSCPLCPPAEAHSQQ